MPGTYVSGGIKHPIHNQISELQRKIQLLEGDRSAYFESSQSAIKKNRETISQLRHDNKNLHKKLAEGDEQAIKDVFQGRGMEKASFRNMSCKSARTVLEKEVCDKIKKLNAMKHTTQTQRQRFEELKLQYQSMKPESMKPQSRSPLPDNQKLEEEEKKLRILENRLEKTQLKYHEAEHIMRGYLKLKDHLQEDSLTFQPQLDRMEAEIHRQTQVLKELQVMNSDAHLSKDAAKAELQLQEEQVYRERREREKILSRYKKQAEERIAQAERMKRRPQWAAMHPDELSSEAQRSANAVEEVEAISTFEEAFHQIKEATGVTDSREIVDRFISQGETQEHLEKMKVENERMLLQLKEERNTLQTQLQDMKYSRETELSSSQQMLQDCERQLQQEQLRRDAVKDRLDRLTHTLNTVKAGVQQLSDKLQHIPLIKGPTPQLPPDSEEQTLQLMSEAEQKLMLLKEELQGKDLATILKEMEEEEFPARIAGKLPQYNTRIQLHEAQKQDSFDDEDDSGDDEGDVITRLTLKHQSQSIIDTNTKRKTRIKKRKGKL
ncbi:coiled-coil domain-containing protein 151 [Rhinichthys klamathensis goyatoka]|uniref:coiled-coil domain-containing protein 151 n=1 Tax=Rhinichthys klamathensis goyatoka TaxID=3034132 RepID=UPI0024B493EC|nr:coiled-coil domain-containing protein 151 [Rhinichthys klamathensis goyatoka]